MEGLLNLFSFSHFFPFLPHNNQIMSLSKHVDADELIERAAASDHLSLVQRAKGARKVSNCILLPGFNKRFSNAHTSPSLFHCLLIHQHISSAHAGRYATDPIPKVRNSPSCCLFLPSPPLLFPRSPFLIMLFSFFFSFSTLCQRLVSGE